MRARLTSPVQPGHWLTRLCLRGLCCLGLLVLPAGILPAVDEPVLKEQERRISLIQQMTPAVVAIFAKDGNGGGSGVLISPDGYALTNWHVVTGQGPFMKCGLNDGRLYDAVLVGLDPTGDVAVIKLHGRDDFPVAKIGNSDTVRVGDGTYAIGNPFLLATDFQPTVTYGMVSGVNRYQFPSSTILEYTDCIQVDTSINPGNSGGPLFNERGEVIGINGRISVEDRGRKNVGAGYAISINQVMNFLDHLKSGRIVDHATLGATVVSGSNGTVTVNNILENSDAWRRGLRVNDQVVSFAGRPVTTANEFKNILGIYPDGWKVPLVYRRDDANQQIMVRLRRLHRASELELQESAPKPPEKPEKPPEKKEKDGDKDQDGEPVPAKDKQAATIPDDLKSQYEEAPGFANFYFNRVMQERLLGRFSEWGDFGSPDSSWQINGQLEGKTPVQIRLSQRAIALKLGEKTFGQSLDEDLTELPPATGGLLPAIHFLRQMLVSQKEGFSEVVYLGSEPLDGTGPKVFVIETLRSTATCRWYFNRDSEDCVGFDYRGQDDADACELRFGSLKSFNGRSLPESITLKHADRSLGVMTISDLQMTAAPATP